MAATWVKSTGYIFKSTIERLFTANRKFYVIGTLSTLKRSICKLLLNLNFSTLNYELNSVVQVHIKSSSIESTHTLGTKIQWVTSYSNVL